MSSVPNSLDFIAGRILRNAGRFENRDAVVFLDRGEVVSAKRSYGALVSEVARIAGRLAAEGLSRRPVLVVLPAGVPFVTVFLACLWARAAAIPAPYPATARSFNRLRAVLMDSRPAALVTDEATAARLADLAPDIECPRLIMASSLTDDAEPIDPLAGSPDEPALIQYTSGSTRAPRGIVITHGNLFANQEMIQSAFHHDESCVGANWLPHFHDMGLLGVILQPLFVGGSTVLMDPLAFVQKPIRWLRAIDRFRATTAGGPCFAFDLCVRRSTPEEVEELDLSSWRVAFCGSEPIRGPVLDRFAQKFAGAGFNRRSLVPCYGLSEATLIVSSATPGEGLRELPVTRRDDGRGRSPVLAASCGIPAPGCSIQIRGEDGAKLSEGEAGEIYVSGPHLSPGFWNGSQNRVDPFDMLVEDEAGERLLPTGDIGAIVEGELVPIDRIKDTIIVYGQKLLASDVEATLLGHPLGADLLAACAFSVDGPDGAEMIVLCEMERRNFRAGQANAIAAQLPKTLAEAFGVLPRLKILPYGTLPRTTSGKIQRQASKTVYLGGELDGEEPPDSGRSRAE